MASNMMLPPDENRGHVYFSVLITFLVLSTSIFIARIFMRLRYTFMWWDDWLVCMALPCIWVNQIISIESIKYGIGRHIFYLKPADAMEAAKLNTIAEPLWIWALYFTKMSIVFFLLRIKPGKYYKWVLYFTMGLLSAITLVVFIIDMAQCQPLAKEWNPIIEGTCWNPHIFANSVFALSGITILTDIVYIVIPIIYLWNSQLERSTKWGIWGVLSLGLVSMGCSIAAIPFQDALGQTTDATWAIINSATIKTAELNVSFIVACMPPLQPLFKKARNKVFRTENRTAPTWDAKAGAWESRQLGKSRRYASGYEMTVGKDDPANFDESEMSLKGAGACMGEYTSTSTCMCQNCQNQRANDPKLQKAIMATTVTRIDEEYHPPRASSSFSTSY